MGDAILFLIGALMATWICSWLKTSDSDIVQSHAIYIKDVEYRCKAVTP